MLNCSPVSFQDSSQKVAGSVKLSQQDVLEGPGEAVAPALINTFI